MSASFHVVPLSAAEAGASSLQPASGQSQINGLASDRKYLYWTSSNGIVAGVAK